VRRFAFGGEGERNAVWGCFGTGGVSKRGRCSGWDHRFRVDGDSREMGRRFGRQGEGVIERRSWIEGGIRTAFIEACGR